MANPSSVEQRFWNKVSKSEGCWLWTAGHDQKGYGIFYFGHKNERASHVSLILAGRSVPAGMDVCHTCDNPPCVRPDHLFIGTRSDNMKDCASKGRLNFQTNPEILLRGDAHPARLHPELLARGERNGRASLTVEMVLEIRRLRKESHFTYQKIADTLRISKGAVSCVLNGQTWRHI